MQAVDGNIEQLSRYDVNKFVCCTCHCFLFNGLERSLGYSLFPLSKSMGIVLSARYEWFMLVLYLRGGGKDGVQIR